jgi:hypothetical protein
MECYALWLPSLDPRANMRQIFNGNCSLRAFGLRNNPFGEVVVHPSGKSVFLTRQLPQSAATAERAFLLELLSQGTMTVAHVLDRVSAVDFPIAINRNIGDTEIDTQDAFHINWFGRFNIRSCEQIPVATHEGQIGFATSEGQQCPLPIPTH